MWCIAKVTPEYIERMMDILEIYELPYNPKFPVICFDEKTKQLLGDVTNPIPASPGKIKKVDYNYKRNGVVNLFVSVEPRGKKRYITTTKRRTKVDFAKEIERLVKRYKKAEKIILITDNLNTHSAKCIVDAFGKERGDKIIDKIDWHYTPKHASWLNMAEIEINTLSNQCLKRKIPTFQEMQKQVAAYKNNRNKKELGINWQFTREKAKTKFKIEDNAIYKN